MSIGKTQLIDDIAATTDLTKAQATKAVDGLLHAITHRAAEGEKIIVKGFGTFAIKIRAARTSRNPRTGETVQVPAKSVLTFKAASPRS
jgi:DNA-binding protein HU-beta